jgi:hypothetical protein
MSRCTLLAIALCIGVFVASVLAVPAHAATPTQPASGTGTSEELFGSLKAPDGVDKYNADPRAANGLGIMVFFSNLLRLNTIVAGIWSMVNIALAGLLKIQSADDSGATKKVNDKITASIIGLVIIVGSYTIAGLIGLLLFGNATFILNPTLKGIT